MSDERRIVVQLKTCAQILAQRCDGAHAIDGQGFNQLDSRFGRELAETPAEAWSPKLAIAAYKMLGKYRRQLAAAGLDFSDIAEPLPPLEPREIMADPAGQGVALRSPYDSVLVDGIKAMLPMNARRWDSTRRFWLLALDQYKIIREIARRFSLTITDEAEQRLQAAAVRGQQLHADPNGRGWTRDTVELPPPAPAATLIDWDTRALCFRLVAPYDRELVAKLHELPGARWDKSNWRIPASPLMVRQLRDVAAEFSIELSEKATAELATLEHDALANLEASTATDAELHLEGLGGTLMPFQRAGVAQGTKLGKVLLCDEMGLGKTVQAAAIVHARSAWPALIVCPATLKPNWARELRRWLPGRKIGIIGGSDAENRYAVERCDLCIVNFDLLGAPPAKYEASRKKAGETDLAYARREQREHRQHDLLQARYRLLASRAWRAVVVDEAHHCKNPKALRTVAMLGLTKDRDTVVVSTGTPVLNRPKELIELLKMVGALEKLGGVWGFLGAAGFAKGKFGLVEISEGAAARGHRLARLNARLRAVCMIRRLKADVLKDLPAKRRTTVTMPLTNREDYERAARDMMAWLLEHDPEKASAAERAEQLVRIEKLKQLALAGKMAALKEWVTEFAESGEKLVLFAHHIQAQHQLAATLRDTLGSAAVVTILGEHSPAERDAAVVAFQTDPGVKVVVASLKAAGVGITLTAASNVAFAEFGWTPADHDQAEDRCHRIGQHDSVMAWYLAGEKTIDEEILELIGEKRVVVDALTDGRITDETGKTSSMLHALVDRLREKRARQLGPGPGALV